MYSVIEDGMSFHLICLGGGGGKWHLQWEYCFRASDGKCGSGGFDIFFIILVYNVMNNFGQFLI